MENGQGEVFNKNGDEAMEWEVDEADHFSTENLATKSRWRQQQMILNPEHNGSSEQIDVVMEELKKK